MYKSFNQLGREKQPQTVVELKSYSELIETIKQNRCVCVDVYATWCKPCINIAEDYVTLAGKYSDDSLKVCKINIDDLGDDYVHELNIKSVPTFLFYVDGEELKEYRILGANLSDVQNNLISLKGNTENRNKNNGNYVQMNLSGNAIRNWK